MSLEEKRSSDEYLFLEPRGRIDRLPNQGQRKLAALRRTAAVPQFPCASLGLVPPPRVELTSQFSSVVEFSRQIALNADAVRDRAERFA
jgi:hypothetical protein